MATAAAACRKGIADATARWPNRRKASDGILGDARHQRRPSDHNLGNAFDITHDPRSGCDGSIIAALAIRDPRVTYVIWNRRIYSKARAADGWRRYTGDNAHTHHCHVSIRSTARADTRTWAWASVTGIAPAPVADEPRTPAPANGARSRESTSYPNVVLRLGARGELVGRLQQRLRARGWVVDVDRAFGPGTDRAVRQFQRRHDLEDDGIVGRRTWNAIFSA